MQQCARHRQKDAGVTGGNISQRDGVEAISHHNARPGRPERQAWFGFVPIFRRCGSGSVV